MASKAKEVTRASIRLYPVIDGLAKMIREEITKSSAPVEKESRKIGQRVAKSIKEGMDVLDNSGLKQKLSQGISGGFSSMNSIATSAFRRVGGAATSILSSSFRGASRVLSSSMITAGKAAAVGLGGVLATGLGVSVSKGLGRALSMTEARAKMKGLGYEGAQLEAIMTSASDAMDGLAYSTGDAATAASGLLASGVKPGEDLTKILRTIGDTASLTGRDFGDISSIYGKVFASGIIQGEELNQLMDSGVPILQYLSKSLKMSAADVKKLASQGKISSAQFAKAMEENLGGVGERMAQNSFKLSAKNVASQMGRIFEPIFTTAIESAIPVLGTIRSKLRDFVGFIKPVLKPLQDGIKEAFEDIGSFIERFDMGAAFTRASTALESFKGIILPIAGLIIGMSGSLLSSIPIIGGLFSGLTGPVGLLVGFFLQVLASSEKLRTALGNLGGSIGDLFKSIFNVNMDEFDFGSIFGGIGDKLAGGVDKITGIVDTKGGEISSVLSKMWGSIINAETLETLKSAGERIFGGIGDIFSGLFAIILEVASDPRVHLAFAQISDAIGAGIQAISQVTAGSNPAEIGSTIASFVAILGAAIASIVEVAAWIATQVVKFASSKVFEDISGWMKGIAQVLVGSAGLMKVVLGAAGIIIAGIGALVVGFKVMSLLDTIGLPAGGGSLGKKLGNLMKGLGKALAGAIRAIPGIATALVSATPHILAAIGAAALILLALGFVGTILRDFGIGEGLKKLGEVLGMLVEGIMIILTAFVNGIVDMMTRNAPLVAEALGAIFTSLKPVLDFILDVLTLTVTAIVVILRDVLLPIIESLLGNFGAILGGIADVIMALGLGIYVILEGLALLIETILIGSVVLLDGFARAVGSVITSLLSGGLTAAAAALALAGGIAALNAAMAGGTFMQGAANLSSSFMNVGKGVLDKINPANWGKDVAPAEVPVSAVAQIVELVNALQSATDIVNNLQTNWNNVAAAALVAGANIISNLTAGINNNAYTMGNALSTAISNMLLNAQLQLDSAPLQVRVSVPAELSGTSLGSANFSGQTSNTQNNNFNITNQNPQVVASAIENMMR